MTKPNECFGARLIGKPGRPYLDGIEWPVIWISADSDDLVGFELDEFERGGPDRMAAHVAGRRTRGSAGRDCSGDFHGILAMQKKWRRKDPTPQDIAWSGGQGAKLR